MKFHIYPSLGLSEKLKESHQTKAECRKTRAAFFTFLLGHMQQVANMLSTISHSKYAWAPTPSYVGGYEEPVIVRRQRKITQKYYSYQLATTGWRWKWNAISQVAYHCLANVLTKANKRHNQLSSLGVTVARWTCADRKICVALGRHSIVPRNSNYSIQNYKTEK